MNYSEDTSKAGEFLRLTLAYLVKYGLPANPVNYTVWYEYVAGKNPKLKKALDSSIETASPINGKNIEKLYEKFVTDGDRIIIAKLLTKINLMLREITDNVLETEGDLADHTRNLGDLAAEIRETADIEGIKQIVDKMILETKALVKSGSRLQAKMKVSSEDLKQLHVQLEKSQKEAQTDSLTGLINRRGLERHMEIERIRAKQNNAAFSIILLDIDHFKRVNDNFGHLVGDSLLRGFATVLTDQLRQKDIAARYGGEEFLILLPETGLNGASAAASKIQKALENKEWKIKDNGKNIGTITASMGVSVYSINEPTEELIRRADEALYAAKQTGRNKVVTQMALIN